MYVMCYKWTILSLKIYFNKWGKFYRIVLCSLFFQKRTIKHHINNKIGSNYCLPTFSKTFPSFFKTIKFWRRSNHQQISAIIIFFTQKRKQFFCLYRQGLGYILRRLDKMYGIFKNIKNFFDICINVNRNVPGNF